MRTLYHFATILFVTLSIFAGGVYGQTLTTLWSFSNSNDGGTPWGGVVQGNDGNFYGTTFIGGIPSFNENQGNGIVYRITPNGTFTNIYQFMGYPYDGSGPQHMELVQGSDGNFYGTTFRGGGWDADGYQEGAGTIFRISPSGIETNLHAFQLFGDGGFPYAGLVQGTDGNFYGTTESGESGDGTCCGNVFVVTSNGAFTALHFFTGTPDGKFPESALVQGIDGNFYGTTFLGGTTNKTIYNGTGYGTVFRIAPNGSYTNLHAFAGYPSDGELPLAALVQSTDGNLYGTTEGGGTTNYGTIFRISPSGVYTCLYSFGTAPTDGRYPAARLLQGSDGSFYGTTSGGGSSTNCTFGCGTVFRFSLTGKLTTLYSFNGNDGSDPFSLIQGSDGNFYGTTFSGGYTNLNGGSGYGTVFRISAPLNSLPNQISGFIKTDDNIAISIPSIAYQTYQLQFSSSMNPTNWVNVPAASVTNCIGGLLTLTNFGGALSSQGFYRFDVTP